MKRRNRKIRRKVVVVMPAFNAEKTLVKTFNDIPKKYVDEIILVDDGSHDRTVKIAKKLRLTVVIHPQNRGYGGNQKTCYTLALNAEADIIVMIHPDYQYDSTLTPEIIRPLINKRFDIVIGSRIRTRNEVLQGGMPFYKYIGNRFLTIIQNVVLGQNLSEYHSGFRCFSKNVLKKLPYHKFSDDFVFDQEILISAIREGFKIGEIQVPTRYLRDSSSISFNRSVVYGLNTLVCLLFYCLDRFGIYSSKIFCKNKS